MLGGETDVVLMLRRMEIRFACRTDAERLGGEKVGAVGGPNFYSKLGTIP